MQTAELTDEEMIARIQQGEAGILERLIDRYYDDIYYFCRSKIGDSEAAYDCAQRLFLKLTRYISGYREQKKFKGYLFSIARNVCHDYFGENRRIWQERKCWRHCRRQEMCFRERKTRIFWSGRWRFFRKDREKL